MTFNNLGRVIEEEQITLILPAKRSNLVGLKPIHKSAQEVQYNDRVVAFYNEDIQDKDI